MVAPSGKEDFIHPQRSFRGDFTPENLLLDANIQEFASKVSILCALENSGKLSPVDAYEQIKDLWHKLELSRRNIFE